VLAGNDLNWRTRVLGRLERIFAPSEQSHGLDHAIHVERMGLEIAKEPEFADIPLDMTVLRAAALLHDAGHAAAEPSWSSDRGEHIVAGARIAREILTAILPFAQDEKRLDQVCYLILNHDQTNYSFPIATRDGEVADPVSEERDVIRADNLAEEKKLQAMLAILNDADSRSSTGSTGAEKTLKYSVSRGVPGFASGNPLNAWMWEESAVGNVRLAAKRALLDACTAASRELAWQGYREAEEYIETFCKNNGVKYTAEMCREALRSTPPNPRDTSLEITRLEPWGRLASALQRVNLHGDALLFPYAAATIESRIVEINRLSPLSRYVLAGQVKLHEQLRGLFLAKYALDPLDLSGIIEFRWEGKTYRMGPPIVEVYQEEEGELKGEVWALVDGLHRCFFAKRSGLSNIRVVVIRQVPSHFPLVPLPVRWEDVTEVEDVPRETQKRKFRYPELRSFLDISWFSGAKPATDHDARYFFFRDLSPLASLGIRQSPPELPHVAEGTTAGGS